MVCDRFRPLPNLVILKNPPLIDSLRPGVVAPISSRYCRRVSSVCGMAHLANRLLHVPAPPFITVSPLPSATMLCAVDSSACLFI